MPGGWRNFKRYGTNWSFLNVNRPSGIDEMLVTWHTFHPNGGRPVWLTTPNSPFSTESNGERRWQGDLIENSYNAQTLTKTSTVVGHVSVVFPPGSATRAAVRWQWDAVDSLEHEECLYNFFREPNPSNAPNVEGSINEAFTSNWFDPATSGWGVDFEAGTDLSGNYSEVTFADIYDSQGRAMWLYAQTNTASWQQLTWQDGDLAYYRGLYDITQDCNTDTLCRVRTDFVRPTHKFGRTFQSPFSATMQVKASGTIASTGQSFTWPLANFPTPNPNPPLGCPSGQNCRPMVRLTDGEQIVLSQTQCYIPPGGTNCSLLVSWVSSADASIYRYNLTNSQYTLIGSGVTGEVTETLVNGSRFKYRIKKDGVTTFESPEVTGIGQAGPLPDIAPTLPSVPSYSDPANAVGYTGGVFRVDEGGSATYKIPIFAPQGRGKLSPTFVLNYSSSGGDGQMGLGWGLEGVSVISRCRFTLETDGHTTPLDDSAQSHGFCLDGQRLVKVNGVENGKAGAEYRTEIETFQKVVINSHESFATANNPVAWQPTSFTVYGKDGTRRTFGTNSSKRIRNLGSVPYILEWWESTRSDTTDNTITYTYAGNPDTGSFALSQASYIGGRVEFQSGPRTSPSVTYFNGLKLIQDKRLNKILVYSQSDQELRRYSMTYEPVPRNESLSRLAEIQECVATSCFKPTTFDWYDQPLANQANLDVTEGVSGFDALRTFKLGDVNGDGRADVVWVNEDDYLEITFSQPTQAGQQFSPSYAVTPIEGENDQRSRTWALLDYNADGREDLIIYKAGSWRIWLSDGSTFVNSGISVPSSGSVSSRTPELLLADFSGDGLPDMLVYDGDTGAGPTSFAWMMERETDPLVGRPYRFSSRYEVDMQGAPCGTVSFPEFDTTRSEALDVNGDGQSDLVLRSENCFKDDGEITPIDPPTGSNAGGPIIILPPTSSVNWIGMEEWTAGRASEGRDETAGSIAIFRMEGMDVASPGSTGIIHFNQVGTPWQENINLNSFRVADLNGDGYGDAIWNKPQSKYWKYSLGDGRDFTEIKCVLGTLPDCDTGAGSTYGVQVADYNGDGRMDFWVRTSPEVPGDDDHKYAVHVWTGDGFDPSPAQTFFQSGGIPWVRSVADLDGDGYLDVLRIGTSGGHPWKVQRSKGHHSPRNLIKTISQGMGAVTSLSYEPTTFRSVYGRKYDAAQIVSGRGTPVQDILIARFVVNRVVSSAPTDTNASNGAEIRYRYEGFRMQGGGRGSLGFQRVYTLVETADSSVKLETITDYEQRFPLTGLPKTSRVIKGGDWPDWCRQAGVPNSDDLSCMKHEELAPPLATRYVLNETVDTWNWRNPGSPALDPPLQVGPPPVPLLVEKTISRVKKRDLTNALLSFESTSTTYDDNGNVMSSTASNYDDDFVFPRLLRSVETVNTYQDNVSLWFLGRLATTTVTTTRFGKFGTPLGSVIRQSAFEYDPITGLMTLERIQPNGGASETLSSYHQYDAYGNRTATWTCSRDMSDANCRALSSSTIRFKPSDSRYVQRYSRIEMDGNSIFAFKAFEPFHTGVAAGVAGSLEKAVSTVVRDAYGNPTSTTDVNGAVEVAAYDAFGRPRFAGNSTGASATTTRTWCENTFCPTAGGGASHVVRVAPTKGAKTWTYFDRLDREVMSVTEGFSSSGATYVAVRKTYDEQGRPKKVSEPYYTFDPGTAQVGTPNSTSVYWTVNTYDALGRVVGIVHPNSATTSIAIAGRTTTTTQPVNAQGIAETKTQAMNFLGEVEEITDHLGTKLKYEFDAVGNVTTVTRKPTSGPEYVTTSAYDALGRRTLLQDEDTGTWSTAYNAAGETIKETSASTCTITSYDARGRAWTRSDFPNASCTGAAEALAEWRFDTSPNQKGYGQLDQVTSTDGNGTTATPVAYVRSEEHDALGRINRIETTIAGKTYIDRTTFDDVGRVRQTFFSSSTIPESGEYLQYDAKGYPTVVRDVMNGAGGSIYHEVTQRNARGQVTEERRADNALLVTSHSYEASTGRLLSLVTPNVQALSYAYDALGNVRDRWDQSPGTYIHEIHEYDGLQRLTKTKFMNQNGTERTATEAAYDVLGNRYPNAANAVYGTKASACSVAERDPGPGALSAMNGLQYCYDDRGNRVRAIAGSVTKEAVAYTAYNQVRDVRSTQSGAPVHSTLYYYGPERQRIRRLDYPAATPTGSSFDAADTVGNAEILVRMSSTSREVRRHIGAVILSRTVTAAGVVVGSQNRYVFADAQGSPHRITTAFGESFGTESAQGFTAFGARANAQTGDMLSFAQVVMLPGTLTRKGYTGHEQADGVGLVHMNGRMYDPFTARFLQPDPFVQDPTNLQSLNRYSYVLNRPFVYTDPTGYWGAKEQGALRTAVAIVIVVCTGAYISSLGTSITTAQAAGIAAAGGAAAGAVQTGTLRGALIGAFSGFVGYQIGSAFKGAEGSFGHVASHATLGGVTSVLNGGKFGHGFVAAGFSTALDPTVDTGSSFGNGIVHAMVGGTASVISGGKFGNGAVTAAFAYALNSGAHKTSAHERAEANAQLDSSNIRLGEVFEMCYGSADAARFAAANRWAPFGYRSGREANWYVVELTGDSGSFGFTYAHSGAEGDVSVAPAAIKFVSRQSSVSRIESLGHNHLSGDLKFSDYDRQLVDNVRYRNYKLWLWNDQGKASTIGYGAGGGSIVPSATYSGTRAQSFDIPVTW